MSVNEFVGHFLTKAHHPTPLGGRNAKHEGWSNPILKRSDHTTLEAPQRRGRNLVETVGQRLRNAIAKGDLKPGDKLPSESGLTQQHQVSRTVIREAIASLRADGLVEVRHGVGVFVLAPQAGLQKGFRSVDSNRVSSIIEMLEVRAAIEIEAAGLAASRSSPAQQELIFECLDTMNRQIAAGSSTVESDRAFHLAIADSTNNPRFRELLEAIGQQMIPRSLLQEEDVDISPPDYLSQIQSEHSLIARAIADGDDSAARDAMRTHLKGSQQRYRALIRRS
ncbi:DNA-binding transcriptional regulator, FadR family [Xaviernesmea oryzae]|uniref:DNA-binding transcriptional regulator, FadR family n=1 Tax=Xaviernesmea oryzae TaxID=464029 RepID=A0A1X7DT27_9HYPH|nr:FadR/GntR family transcriptional regulator [Xaviernesmea oryzae]SMF21250.1 DNA-binding transcriptional regulator, FadR family [Xaviernesmea oryzae]